MSEAPYGSPPPPPPPAGSHVPTTGPGGAALPPPAQQVPPPPGYQHFQAAGTAGAPSNDEKNMAVLIHVLLIFTGFVGPLIIWLIKRDESPFVDLHGKTALNFAITLTLAVIASAILIIVLIGLLLLFVLMIVGFVLPIIAAVKASKGEAYTYPFTIKFLS